MILRRLAGIGVSLFCLQPTYGKNNPQSDLAFLRRDEVNFREGPAVKHGILWTYHSPGWPVKVLRTYGNWHYVIDFTGTSGWVKGSLLGFVPTYLVLEEKNLYDSFSENSRLIATLEKGVIVQCSKDESKKYPKGWLKVDVYSRQGGKKLKGWIHDKNLWPKRS